MRAITLALGLLVIVIEATASGQVSSAAVQLPHQSIASAFVSNQVEPLRQFRALRHLEATNKRFNKHGWMDVRTELSPDGHFSFEVLAEGDRDEVHVVRLLHDQAELARGRLSPRERENAWELTRGSSRP